MADLSSPAAFPLDLAGRRARVGEECGEVFEPDEDYDGLTVAIELRSHAEARAVIGWLDTLGAVTSDGMEPEEDDG